MTARRKSFLSVLLMAIVIGGVFVAFRVYNSRPERIIEGRPLSEWVRELGNPNFSAPRERAEHAAEALAEQSPAIIPELVEFRTQTRLTARLQPQRSKWARKIGLAATEPVNWALARNELLRVISQIAQKNGLAFETRPEAQPAVEDLLRELKAASPTNAAVYFYMLAQFGVNATNALPTLVKFLPVMCSATNFPEGISTLLTSIADIGPGPCSPQVIAVATNLLSSVDRMEVEAALRALGACGTNASAFVPQIAERVSYSERFGYSDNISGAALLALAEIGHIPTELKTRLADLTERGSGVAAVAMLQMDPKEPTALNIVQARLHPLAGRDHTQMIQLVSRVPNIAKLFVPELEKLARKTNAPTASLARQTLRQLAAQPNAVTSR